MNHYKWLENNLPVFFDNIGLSNYKKYCQSIISADGDKCGSYERKWQQNNIPFVHGVALYLITKISPYNIEARETKNGWIDPGNWVIDNYNKFKIFLPNI
jgi:hypothetical protein